MVRLPAPVLFGAAYYPEYLTSDRLAEDMALMQAAGFTVIRVGESTWSTWEPEDGRFDLDWLEPTLDAAHAHGIAVVLGTPTYALPPWLARKHPELAAERRTGEPIPWGGRQDMDYTHPAFRFHAERVTRAVVGRYCDHPAVIGYQVDNEPGLVLFHNRGVFEGFVDELRHEFGDVEALNEAWGLVYWSHRLSTWSDLWVPDGNTTPQYDLAWRRYQARLTDEYIAWQASIVRTYARADQFVTTCVAFGHPGVDDPGLARDLDITAGNLYYGTQAALALPGAEVTPQGWSITGVGQLWLAIDRVYAAKQAPFLVTETNAGTIGGSAMNFSAYDGQWRQVAWAMVARGARMVEYWHWHSLPWGTETYWTGVLPHDGQPGRVYREVAALGQELRAAGPLVDDLVPDATVGLLWSNASRWALTAQSPWPDDHGADHNPEAYATIVEAFYQGAFGAGLPVRVVHDVQTVELDPAAVAGELPVLLVPALYVAGEGLIEWLRAYVGAGGHLVLGPRSLYADSGARVLSVPKPAGLVDLAGLTYQELSNLQAPLRVMGSADFAVPPDATADRWVEGLLPAAGADVLATYDHPHFGQYAAIVSHQAGAGRVTTVGTLPSRGLATAVLRWAAGGDDPWRALNQGAVTVTSATVSGGHRLRVLHNWSWTPAIVRLPEPAADLADVTRILPEGTTLDLGPWDVRVLRQ
ncbi:MAG: beta-galactosidase [Propionibacteriaceae bacterium]|jgi:beta-galactosidase|nr:beta-galactosidase [Propionibacteriaceae bacterium]